MKAEFGTSPGAEQGAVLKQSNVDVQGRGLGSICRIRKGVEKCKPTRFEVSTLYDPAQPAVGRCVKHRGGKFQDANCSALAEPGKGKFEFNPAV